MSLLAWVLIVWGVLTALLILILIYRSTLTRQEDEQLYLTESQSHMQKEQMALQKRVSQINPWVRILSVASGVLILLVAGMWIYQGLVSSAQ
jgi:hypothetical protein